MAPRDIENRLRTTDAPSPRRSSRINVSLRAAEPEGLRSKSNWAMDEKSGKPFSVGSALTEASMADTAAASASVGTATSTAHSGHSTRWPAFFEPTCSRRLHDGHWNWMGMAQ